YIRIKVTTAITIGVSQFLDELSLVEAVELYPGGPFAAAFGGSVEFSIGNEQVEPDQFEITVTNDRAGEFQDWFNRNFDMAGKRLLLPTASSTNETLSDSLIG